MTFIRKYLAFVEPGRRARWAGLVLMALVVGAFEAVGAVLIYLMLRLVAEPGAELSVPLLGDLNAAFPGLDSAALITAAALSIAAFFLVRAGVVVGQAYLQGRVAERTGLRLASRLLRGYLAMPYPFHVRRNSAELLRNVVESAHEVMAAVLVPVVKLISETLIILALGVVLLMTAPLALAVAAIVFAPVVLVLLRVVQPRLAALGRTSHELAETTLKSVQQGLHGFRDVKVLGRERYFHDRFYGAREGIARAQYLRRTLDEVPRVTLETAMVLFVAVALLVALQADQSPQESLAVLGLFGYAALRILPSLNRLVMQLNAIRFGGAAASKVYEELGVIEAERGRPAEMAPAAEDRLPLRHQIRVEGVRFRYEGSDTDALSGIDLAIRRGESIGLAGASGAGKTTLVDVILGLLPPASGQVTVDGTDIQTCLPAWHRSLGVVPQSVYLVDDTLRRNIALGLEDREIDEERVTDAVRLAQLTSFVRALPRGLDTEVGERGVRVSGGQRQRVAIARALYRQPDTLIFDEGTSALDNLTEAELIAELEGLRGEHTLIIVAHRLTTVRRCDRVVLMDAGRIVANGPYDELLEHSPEFQNLAGSR